MTRKKTYWGAIIVLFPATVLSEACQADGNAMIIVGDACDGSCASPPPFVSPDASSDGDPALGLAPALLCVGTAETPCPAPYGTCGEGKCATDLSSDLHHCGTCENNCELTLQDPFWKNVLHLLPTCSNGECKAVCDTNSNCNGRPDDGCETDTLYDSSNCGSCGHKCPDGTRCWQGQCGCPADQTMCESDMDDLGGAGASQAHVDESTTPPTYYRCVDTKTDDGHCGACKHVCPPAPPPEPCGTLPPQTALGCADGVCGRVKCKSGYGDCDNDYDQGCDSNGCETQFARNRDNCGECGAKCTPDQACVAPSQGRGWHCNDANETLCGLKANLSAKDLMNDPTNCGACGNVCPWTNVSNLKDTGQAVCRNGICGYTCSEGKADCDGDIATGCETDITFNDLNCGACGHRCDTAAGQPCVHGECLMTECDAGQPVPQ